LTPYAFISRGYVRGRLDGIEVEAVPVEVVRAEDKSPDSKPVLIPDEMMQGVDD